MEDLVDVNGVKDVNGGTNRIYYELDGEGDADSSTTPRNVDHHRDRKFDCNILSCHWTPIYVNSFRKETCTKRILINTCDDLELLHTTVA